MTTKRILTKRGGLTCRMRLLAVCTVAAMVINASALAQAPRFGWAAQGHGSGGLNDMVNGLAVDAGGDTYVSGNFCSGTISFGGTVLTNASPAGLWGPAFLVKYDSAGNMLWARQSGSNDLSGGAACAPALDRGVLLAGRFFSHLTFGGTILTNFGQLGSVFVGRFSASGDLVWIRPAGGSNGNDVPIRATTDSGDNLYVSGFLGSTDAMFGTNELSNSHPGGYDAFLAKYDDAGNVLWAKSIKGANGALSATDPSGYSYITGSFTGVCDFGGGVMITNSSGNGTGHGFVAKYDPGGNALWAREAGTGASCGVYAIAVAPTGGCVIGGGFSGGNLAFGGTTFTNRGGDDGFVARYDSSGNLVWAVGSGGNSDDDVLGMGADATGNCYALGWSYSTNFSASGLTLTNALYQLGQDIEAEKELFVLKYRADGAILWAKGTPMSVGGNFGGAAVDRWANVHVAAMFEASSPKYVDLDGLTITNTNPGPGPDVFVAELEGTRLTIQPQGNQLMISWPTNAAGLSLESTGDLGAGIWSLVTNAQEISGRNNTLTLGMPVASQFFRLSGP